MKKLILTAGIFFSGIICMNAQSTSQDMETNKMVSNITTVCSLTADEATKATPFIKQFVASRDADKAKYGTTQNEQLKAAIKADRQTLVTNLKPILSADQIQKLEDHWKKQAVKSTTSPQ